MPACLGVYDPFRYGCGACVRRFEAVDKRFDELKSGLRTQIEAVDAKVSLVLEKVDHLIKRDINHSAVHARFDQRLEDHERRLIALEPPAPESR